MPFALSTVSACSIERSRARGPPFWFQLYIVKDRGFVRDMIARAKEAGCGALMLTVDLAVSRASRYRDYRAGSRARCGGSAADRAWQAGAAALGVGRRRARPAA